MLQRKYQPMVMLSGMGSISIIIPVKLAPILIKPVPMMSTFSDQEQIKYFSGLLGFIGEHELPPTTQFIGHNLLLLHCNKMVPNFHVACNTNQKSSSLSWCTNPIMYNTWIMFLSLVWLQNFSLPNLV